MYEEEYPNILFPIDGNLYQLKTTSGWQQALVCGGAYSVDKQHRLATGTNWFCNEQPSDKTKKSVEEKVVESFIEIMLTHTCPERFIPVEKYLPGIDQSKVDRSTEEWFDTIYDKLRHLKRWYCGHWHTTKSIDKIQFLYYDFDIL